MKIEKLDIPNLTEIEWQELYDFTAELFAELYPHESSISLDYVKRIFSETYDDTVCEQYVTKKDDKIIAKVRFAFTKPNALTKEGDIDNVFIDIRVRKDYRRKGFATHLLSYVLKEKLHERHKKIYLSASGSPGYEFCASFDGNISGESFSSRLFFDKTDWENIEKINSKSKEKSHEITAIVTDGVNRESESEYFDIYLEMFEELSKYREDDHFNKELTRKRLKEDKEKEKKEGIKCFVSWARDENGNLIGISELLLSPDNPKKLTTSLTGVTKKHRKKGLCLRMKTDLLLYAKKNLPEVKYVWTSNDKDNAVMRGINHKLGFVAENPYRAYVYKTEEMKKKLGIL